jgi:hypothetical protein
MRLRLLESSIASRFKVSPKIRTDATFDFYNSIGAKRTFGGRTIKSSGVKPGHAHQRNLCQSAY